MHALSISRLSGIQNPKPNAIANCVKCDLPGQAIWFLAGRHITQPEHMHACLCVCSANVEINTVCNEFIYSMCSSLCVRTVISSFQQLIAFVYLSGEFLVTMQKGPGDNDK